MGLYRTSEFPGLNNQTQSYDELTKLQVRFVQAFTVATIIIMALVLMVTFLAATEVISASTRAFVQLVVLIIASTNMLWFYLVTRGYHKIAIPGFMVTFTFLALLMPPAQLLTVLLSLVSGAILLRDVRLFLLLFALIALKFIGEVLAFAPPEGSSIPTADTVFFVLPRIMVLASSLGARYFMRSIRDAVTAAQYSSNLLRTSAEIGQVTTQISDLSGLYERVITLIQERFDFYHVQVFIVNETGDQAILTASTGDVGQRLLQRNHQLAVGSKSVIGQVTFRGEPVIARDTDRDDVHFRNELLIDTRSELALPIRDGANIVGALDIQSKRSDAFDNIDIQALQIIADFIGAALRTKGQFDEETKIAQENRRLLTESENNLREIQRLNRELTHASWEQYTEKEHATTGITYANNRVVPLSEWTDALRQAGEGGEVVTAQQGNSGVIAVPLRLRGEIIGAIEVEADNHSSSETVEMIEAVAQRLAISLENARLYEESREATAQEHFVNELAANFQSVTTVDELLRLTLVELGATLGAQQGAIRLGTFGETNSQYPQNGAAQ